MPIDLAFGLEINQKKQPRTKYVKELRDRLKQSYELAHIAANDARRNQKKYYDLKSRGSLVQIGDRVLVKIVAFDGKHKLSDKWEEDVYVVIDQHNASIPVYIVQRENGEGPRRTLHRNLLLPVGSISDTEQYRPTPSKRRKPEVVTIGPTEIAQSPEHSDSDDSDSEYMVPGTGAMNPVETTEINVEHYTDLL